MEENKGFINGTMMQYFHWFLPSYCGIWNKASYEAEHLANIGITAIWLPPAYKGDDGNVDVGYTVYDLYDLGEFERKGSVETKYGTKEEYLNAIKNLHKNNIQVYADISFEHKIGAEGVEEVEAVEVDPSNRNRIISPKKKILAWTKFDFPIRNNKYSSFKWDCTCFDGVDWDQRDRRKSIYIFSNKDWDNGVDDEFGNYDYLMGADVDFSNNKVRDEIDSWGEWYLSITGVDGFRLDAIKHMNYVFLKEWVLKLRKKTGKELFSVGEYWIDDIDTLENYIKSTDNAMSLFDAPLHFNFQSAASSNGEYDMRNILKGTLMERNPIKAVTFVDNHDTQKGQSLESYVLNWFKPIAYSIILLRNEGYPCIFYGDYYGIQGSVPAFNKELDILMNIRKYKAYGKQNDYFDNSNLIGWTREGDNEHKGSGVAVVVTNGPGGCKKMYIGDGFSGDIFYDALGNDGNRVLINQEGFGWFRVNGGSVSVWIKEEE